jgi:hypothetical protein
VGALIGRPVPSHGLLFRNRLAPAVPLVPRCDSSGAPTPSDGELTTRRRHAYASDATGSAEWRFLLGVGSGSLRRGFGTPASGPPIPCRFRLCLVRRSAARRRCRTRLPTPRALPRLAWFWGPCGGKFDAACDSQRSNRLTRPGSSKSARDGKVKAAICAASLLDHAHGAREVRLALLRVDRDVSCDDDHGCAPLQATRNV